MNNQEIINDLTSIRDYFDVVLNSRCDEVVAQLLTKYKKTIEDIEVKGKKILARCDFNVPMKDGAITDDKRIVGAVPTIKYLADNDFASLSGEALRDAIKAEIQKKDADLFGKMVSEGTTPRRLTDLIGSLCDLTSGSGDKGTPIVFIQGYFDNYTAE